MTFKKIFEDYLRHFRFIFLFLFMFATDSPVICFACATSDTISVLRGQFEGFSWNCKSACLSLYTVLVLLYLFTWCWFFQKFKCLFLQLFWQLSNKAINRNSENVLWWPCMIGAIMGKSKIPKLFWWNSSESGRSAWIETESKNEPAFPVPRFAMSWRLQGSDNKQS